MEEPEDSKKKLIYKAIDYSFINENYIKNNSIYRRDKDGNVIKMQSKNSLVFDIPKMEKIEVIKEIFGLIDNEEFRKKYNEATNGSGIEYRRISVFHSSSLCAFLHFYNIKEKNITINDIVYDEVYFEVQNIVFENHNPSNMDIVLISNANKKILFLEAKFSEYLSTSRKSNKISNQYKKIYESLNLTDEYEIIDDNDGIVLVAKDGNEHYIGGIKQMVSHYIGIKNFIENKKSLDSKIELKDNFEIILGTILFDGWKDEEYLSDYRNEYQKLVNHLNKNKPKELKILDDILTYQEVFKNYNLDEKVKKYYRY